MQRRACWSWRWGCFYYLALLSTSAAWPRRRRAPTSSLARLREGESTLGDLVWRDDNRNGLPGPAESGIDGVLIKLYSDDNDGIFEPGGDDTLIAVMRTGDDSSTPDVEHGWYDFSISITDALYWVEVDASNFAPGGPLEGAVLTSASTIGPSPRIVYLPAGVQDYNDADFGYYGATLSTPTATVAVTPTATATATSSATPTPTATTDLPARHRMLRRQRRHPPGYRF